MNKYEFHATNLIAEAFEKHGVKFDVVNHPGSEQLLAGFPVECGPNVIVRFISLDNDNDVAVRIFGLISNTPAEKRARVMEACNELNHRVRHMKFYIDTDGDINVEYDFLLHSPDEGIGEMAFEIFIRMMEILDSEYGIFMKALYTDKELEVRGHNVPAELMQRLQKLREMIAARTASVLETGGDKDEDDLGPDFETTDPPDDVAC